MNEFCPKIELIDDRLGKIINGGLRDHTFDVRMEGEGGRKN